MNKSVFNQILTIAALILVVASFVVVTWFWLENNEQSSNENNVIITDSLSNHENSKKENNEKNLKIYNDDEYNFEFRYPSDWTFHNLPGRDKFFIKEPLKIEDSLSGKFNDDDCGFSVNALNNQEKKDLYSFWKRWNPDRITLGNKEFVIIFFNITNSDEKEPSYSTINEEKQIFIFSIINSKNDKCIKEVESILSVIIFK